MKKKWKKNEKKIYFIQNKKFKIQKNIIKFYNLIFLFLIKIISINIKNFILFIFLLSYWVFLPIIWATRIIFSVSLLEVGKIVEKELEKKKFLSRLRLTVFPANLSYCIIDELI
jgi:hypothetical protein